MATLVPWVHQSPAAFSIARFRPSAKLGLVALPVAVSVLTPRPLRFPGIGQPALAVGIGLHSLSSTSLRSTRTVLRPSRYPWMTPSATQRRRVLSVTPMYFAASGNVASLRPTV